MALKTYENIAFSWIFTAFSLSIENLFLFSTFSLRFAFIVFVLDLFTVISLSKIWIKIGKIWISQNINIFANLNHNFILLSSSIKCRSDRKKCFIFNFQSNEQKNRKKNNSKKITTTIVFLVITFITIK